MSAVPETGPNHATGQIRSLVNSPKARLLTRLRLLSSTPKRAFVRPIPGRQGERASGITWFAWDGSSNKVYLRGQADFGSAESLAGTVGIDLLEFSGGELAVLATGFNTNKVYEVLISPDGRRYGVMANDAPSGCENPGHGAWYVKDDRLNYLLTCFGGGYASNQSGLSDEIALRDGLSITGASGIAGGTH